MKTGVHKLHNEVSYKAQYINDVKPEKQFEIGRRKHNFSLFEYIALHNAWNLS